MGFCPHGILSGYQRKDRETTALVALDLAIRVVAIIVYDHETVEVPKHILLQQSLPSPAVSVAKHLK